MHYTGIAETGGGGGGGGIQSSHRRRAYITALLVEAAVPTHTTARASALTDRHVATRSDTRHLPDTLGSA